MLSAASMLAAANKPTAASSKGLRPQISLHFAQVGPVAAVASRYAPPIQAYPEAERKSEVIVGIAIETMV